MIQIEGSKKQNNIRSGSNGSAKNQYIPNIYNFDKN